MIGAVRKLASHCHMTYASALKLTAVRVTSRSRIIAAPMITMTRPAFSAHQLRPVEQPGFVHHADQFHSIRHEDSFRVAGNGPERATAPPHQESLRNRGRASTNKRQQ